MIYYVIIFAVIIGFSKSTVDDDDDRNLRHDADIEKYVCRTQECHELAYNIQHNLNKSIDPCTDFYEYGCGNWEKNKSADQLTWHPTQYKTYRRIHELLVEEDKYNEKPFIKIAKQFYRSCINEDFVENEGLQSIKLLLNATGGWPILMTNEEWYQKNYTWQNISNFYYRFYGFSSFFRLIYEQNKIHNKGESKPYILLKNQYFEYPLDESLKDDIYRDVYMEFMIKVIHAFAVDEKIQIPDERLSADVKAVLNFHANLIKIKYGRKTLQRNKIMTIEQLQEFYDFAGPQNSSAKINWLDMIQSAFKDLNVNITALQLVHVDNQNFLRMFVHLLDTTESHVIVNYIQWNMIAQLMQYTNKQIRNIESEYYPTYDVNIGPQARWLTCVINFPMHDIASYVFVKKYISAYTINAVSEMIDEIKEELHRKILSMRWKPLEMGNYTKDKIDNISMHIGYPKWYDNRTDLFNLYEELKIGDNYLENWLAFKKFEMKRELLNIYTTEKNRINIDDWPIYPTQMISLYDKERNMMIIPAALIQDPYFTSNTPSAMNYGAIGSIIAYEFVRSIMDKISNKSDDVITEVEKVTNFQQGMTCLFEQYKNYTSSMRNEYWKSYKDRKQVVKEIFIEFATMQVTFVAFWKTKTDNELKLTTLTNVTDEQLFFLSLANVMCTSARRPYAEDSNLSVYNPKKFRINVILANMKYFADTFKCSVNSPMNPVSKCII